MFDSLKRWMWAPALFVFVTACSPEPSVGDVEGPENDGDSTTSSSSDPVLDDITNAGSTPDGDLVGPVGPEPQPKEETAADFPKLKIKTLVEGEGEGLAKGQHAKVRYLGLLLDGTQFDSNLGKPDPFLVENVGSARVIKGWNLGLIGMKVGEKRRLVVPPDLGYGARGSASIPANSTLVFDVILEEIVSKEPAEPAGDDENGAEKPK